MAKRLARWTPDRAVRVQALAWVIVLSTWVGHLQDLALSGTLLMDTGELSWQPSGQKMLGVICNGLASHPGE